MALNKLSVVAVAKDSEKGNSLGRKKLSRQHQRRAHFERQWLHDPQQFSPETSALERTRLERTRQLIHSLLEGDHPKVADLGCGWGALALWMADQGAQVDALDIANNAVRRLKESAPEGMRLICEGLPDTTLADRDYDLVVCTDVIADLERAEQRLLVAEMQRIVKDQGVVICSSSLDYRTDEAVDFFQGLMETEFVVERRLLSHHAYYLRFLGLLDRISQPLASRARVSDRLCANLEDLCRNLSGERGVSHAILVGTPKPFG